MEIVQYMPRLRHEVGGPFRALVDLATVLASRGCAVRVLASDVKDAPPEWKEGSAGSPELVCLGGPNLLGDRLPKPAARTVSRTIATASIVHLHGVWSVANVQIARMCEAQGVPYVVSVRGMLDDWSMAQKAAKKRLFLRLMGRRFLERAAFVHCTADAELQQAIRHFPRGRGVVIPNLLDLTPFVTLPGPELARARFSISENSGSSLVYLGRLHYKKGVDRLIRAVARLVRDGRDVRLLVAGTGEGRYVASLQRMAEGLGVADRVALLGQVVGAEKLSLLQASDLLVVPTSQENFGFVFYEALGCGLPLVTTFGVDTWRELKASGAAVIVDPTVDAVADAIDGLIEDPAGLRAKGQAGRRWLFANLDPSDIAARYLEHYRSALRREGPTERAVAGTEVPS